MGSIITASPPFAVSASITVIFIVIYFLSGRFRARLRTRLGSISITGTLFGLATTGVLLAAEFSWAKSDILTLIGLLLTIVVTIFADEYVRGFRRIRVGVVIPSRRPFHTELRQGLRDVLDSGRYMLIDPYVEGNNPEEDLANFIPVLQHAINRRSDVLVVCAPSVEIANSPALILECAKFTRQGGHVFFIESIPSDEILGSLRFVTALMSDSHNGAALLSEFVRNRFDALPQEDRVAELVA